MNLYFYRIPAPRVPQGFGGEQGNRLIFTIGTRERSKNIMGNRGTQAQSPFTPWSLPQ